MIPFMAQEPWGEATDDEGTLNRMWRIDDPDAMTALVYRLSPPRAEPMGAPPPATEASPSS